MQPAPSTSASSDPRLIEYINLKLAAMGLPIFGREDEFAYLALSRSLLANYQEKARLLRGHLCPADRAIDAFLRDYLGEDTPQLPALVPTDTFTLDQPGLARVLSLPPDQDKLEGAGLTSYRVYQGVLHNPEKDRRTTQGVFHVTEQGLPVPADKKAVPRRTFAALLRAALNPPKDLLRLPFTASSPQQAHTWVSLLLRPIVLPAVPGLHGEKSLEIRFFAPGGLVANLDFVESIFGNAGDPFLPENDARLDTEHWSGPTGCVILAPHLIHLRKKDLGLPHISEATERQKRDGMCWEHEDEKYNDGGAFKITCRDKRGIIVTLIADTYFGYCKKEVKTQISYAANLFGQAEEEHAGGAIAFPTYDLGEDFQLSTFYPVVDHTFEELIQRHGSRLDLQPEGYAIDKNFPDIRYVPEDARFSLHDQSIEWTAGNGEPRRIRLQPGYTYVLPSGYKVEMIKPPTTLRWRLIGTTAEGTFCHKPCTVSGGGKSEISKSIADAMIAGPVFVADFQKDFDKVDAILNHDYSQRFRDPSRNRPDSRPILSPQRSLGSVIKLLTPSPEYTDEYNAWLRAIPEYIRDLVFIVKRLYKPDWEDNWRQRFSADLIDGHPGNELKYRGQKLLTRYLRVGFAEDGAWRIFSLRRDFMPARKVQTEDDITASTVVPASTVEGLSPHIDRYAWKFLINCESRLFQRPDDAIHRGYDAKTESDFSRPGNFFSNYHPVTREEARAIVEESIAFDKFTEPMQRTIRKFLEEARPDYVVSTAHPRIVDGKPTKNPRYLQLRPDLEDPRPKYLAELGTRLYRRIPEDRGVPMPVNEVLPGRRNNPPNEGIRPLCVYGPIHYQDLPEFFMDAIASLTGKSPSTTGAGSEGALTKGPFNALPPIIDLNNALVAFLLTGYPAFSSAAGWVGPKYRVDHDISLLIPEIWSRMTPAERDPQHLIREGYLERCEDFEHNGRTIAASRLGWRITDRFARIYLGRIFSNPDKVLPEEMLRPEKQDLEIFVDGIDNIVTTQQRVARLYFEDGSVEMACPPLRALLHIMAEGHYEGKDANHPDIRALFTREALLASDWYKERLASRHRYEIGLLESQLRSLEAFLENPVYTAETDRLGIRDRIARTREALEKARQRSPEALTGTLGRDPALD